MKALIDVTLVFVGGGLGAVCRHIIEVLLKYTDEWLGTAVWLINTVGCFLIGLFAGWLLTCDWSQGSKHTFTLLAMTGFCGGFTAFSSFTLDCVRYCTAGKIGAGLVYVVITLLAGLASTGVGLWAGSKFGNANFLFNNL